MLIKTGKNLVAIQPELIETCDRLKLPVFELQHPYSYRPVMQEVARSISEIKLLGWNSELDDFIQQDSNNICQQLCDWLNTKSNSPCVVIDPMGQIFSHEASEKYCAVVHKNIEKICQRGRNQQHFLMQVTESNSILKISVYCTNCGTNLVFILFFLQDLDNQDLDSLGQMSVRRLSHICQEADFRRKEQTKQLLHYAKVLDMKETQEFHALSHFLHIDFEKNHRIILLKTESSSIAQLEEELRKQNCFVLLYPLSSNQLLGMISELENMENLLGIFQKYSCYGGIGSAQSGDNQIENSYREAKMALDLVLDQNIATVASYDDLVLLSLLCNLRDTESLRFFTKKTMEPLIQYDATHSSELIKTLVVLLRFNMNTNLTAQQLFIGKSTLRFRMKKIESISHLSLNSINDLLHLRLGIIAARLYGFIK